MAIRKVHHDTAAIARKYAREELGINGPKLRAPTKKESIDATLHARLDINQLRDTVVVKDKQGQEYLLNIDLHPKRSRDLNVESAMLTASGLVPLVGAPVVAAFAVKDLIKAGSAMAAAKAQGKVADPEHRAIYRMGLRHLGLACLSTATQGTALWLTSLKDVADVAQGAHAAAEAAANADAVHSAYDAAKTVKSGIVGTEAALATGDTANAQAPKGERKFQPLKALVAGLQGIAGVHEHHHRSHDDARVVVVSKKHIDGTVEKRPEITPPRRAEGANSPTGPPA